MEKDLLKRVWELEQQVLQVFSKDYSKVGGGSPKHSGSVQVPCPGGLGSILSSPRIFLEKISRDSMTAALLRLWTVPRLNVVIRTHPVQVRAVLQKNNLAGRERVDSVEPNRQSNPNSFS